MTDTIKPYKVSHEDIVAADIDNSIENIVNSYYEIFQEAQTNYKHPLHAPDVERARPADLNRVKLQLIGAAKNLLRNTDYGSTYYKEAEEELLRFREYKALLQSYDYWKRKIKYMYRGESKPPTYGEVERDMGTVQEDI